MMITLSICIATRNRCNLIKETLESILENNEEKIEIIIVDGASTDNTESVVRELSETNPEIKYFRENSNSGIDQDYDKAMQYASGKYCWLFSDDDLIKPGAITKVICECNKDIYSALIVDAEVRSHDFKKLLLKRRLKHNSTTVYSPEEFSKFLMETICQLTFIGSVIVERKLWLERNRKPFYGSYFIHIGVLFQKTLPKKAIVIADPLVSIRYGNASWSDKTFEIWMVKWPKIVWDLKTIDTNQKIKIVKRHPYKNLKQIFLIKAKGAYSKKEYEKYIKYDFNEYCLKKLILFLIAIMPGKIFNFITWVYIFIFGSHKEFALTDIRNSRFYFLKTFKTA